MSKSAETAAAALLGHLDLPAGSAFVTVRDCRGQEQLVVNLSRGMAVPEHDRPAEFGGHKVVFKSASAPRIKGPAL